MQDGIHRAVDEDVLGDVVLEELEPLVAEQVGDVPDVTGDQVVDGGDAIAFGQQTVAEMRAEKAGAAGHDGMGSGCHWWFNSKWGDSVSSVQRLAPGVTPTLPIP